MHSCMFVRAGVRSGQGRQIPDPGDKANLLNGDGTSSAALNCFPEVVRTKAVVILFCFKWKNIYSGESSSSVFLRLSSTNIALFLHIGSKYIQAYCSYSALNWENELYFLPAV